MTTTPPEPQPVNLADFTDTQLAALLNVGGQMRFLAQGELARRHPLVTDPPAQA